MIDYIQKGGFLMWPILACSIIAIGVFAERLFYLHRATIHVGEFLKGLSNLIQRRNFAEALHESAGTPGPVARVIHSAILRHDLPRSELREIVQEAGQLEVPKLERFLGVLGTLAYLAPLLGLLGTVAGMIEAFAVPISTIAVPSSPTPFSPNPFSPNPFSPNFSPNPFSPNPFSPNYPPIFSNSTFYVAPKGSTSGAVARLDDGGTISGRGPQQLARRSSDARIRNASLTPATPGEYIGEPVNDVMVLTLRDFLLTPPCTSNPTLPCGRPISPANVTVRVKAEVPNVDANGQFDPAGPATTGTQIAHHLAFTVQPTNTTSGGTITPPIKVEIRDTFDDIVTASAQQRQVSLAIAPLTCPGGTLSGTTTTLSSAGVATFSSVVITSSAGCSGVRLVG